MPVWLLIIIAISGDNHLHTIFTNAPTYEANSQESCMAAGAKLSAEYVNSLDPALKKTTKVGFDCKAVTIDSIEKALPPKA